jgi:hypothetical protein
VIERERIKTSGKDFYVMLALMLELEQVQPGSDPFERALKTIAERFKTHAQEQDRILFPELERDGRLDLDSLDHRLLCRKDELCEKMRHFGPRPEFEGSFAPPSIVKHIRCA